MYKMFAFAIKTWNIIATPIYKINKSYTLIKSAKVIPNIKLQNFLKPTTRENYRKSKPKLTIFPPSRTTRFEKSFQF